ncbi:COX assembly mitochondrial protein homolog isoform X5 [Symphalangus syndactylus]|uniref:COX assembly mitochondrial protein homolog isoform X5 n=1 Tax=Symphalangus syndactylus TaxID=9590 RepID=UPI003004CB93
MGDGARTLMTQSPSQAQSQSPESPSPVTADSCLQPALKPPEARLRASCTVPPQRVNSSTKLSSGTNQHLRHVEKDVLIPKIMREKAKERCSEQVQENYYNL